MFARWLDDHAFRAVPDARDERYVVMMPLPNVTGALHMGHAMDNVMQDLLIRWHRMRGDNTLWMPGTDHAGIATQAVVEKRLFELEGKTRHDVGREGLVRRIWDWKDQYQKRIVAQQQRMGCSCDWERQRFTMDAVCSRAVRWTFFNLFRDGLIYRGNRLVNWDAHLQTAVSDDEIVYESVAGFFWHLRYPVIDPEPGEPTHVVVATTRPETMLGDTAVACHPDPAAALDALIAAARAKLAAGPSRDRAEAEAALAELERRRATHLPYLEALAAMARAGRRVRLPLADRPIPIIADPWAKPDLGSGVVKITPGHDPNDYQVWVRQEGRIGILNILNPDGTLNANAGPYAGMDRFAAREAVAADLESQGLLEAKEARETEIGHSDRSRTPIEPYLSEQWFVRMGDVPGGVEFGRETPRAFHGTGLAQAAIDAVAGAWRSATGRKVEFHPDHDRYASTYLNWLAEKRDWCISRQLWWGHRIPIWSLRVDAAGLPAAVDGLRPWLRRDGVCAAVGRADGARLPIGDDTAVADVVRFAGGGGVTARGGHGPSEPAIDLVACLRDETVDAAVAGGLETLGFARDPDVLDTWFSSGIWPHSTLGWPDPSTAVVDDGQLALGPSAGGPAPLDYYYPGSCLVTGRDIITLWVARMVLMGLYNLGDVPFTDVFIHANILDGKGERMSKSKGNGIDPVDIIDRYGADAMRFVLCEMQTGTQDIRLPVQAVSPYTGQVIDLATARHGRSVFTYLDPSTHQEFDVLGTMPDVPSARLISDRFLVGRNFCNKLWNAMRFALIHLEGQPVGPSFHPLEAASLAPEDRWILSRLAAATGEVGRALEAYNPSAAIGAARDFFWNDLCDWYLELVKPRMDDDPADAAVARRVLATVLDQTLRLLHPFVPFITEALWERLNAIAPTRGIHAALPPAGRLVRAAWPVPEPAWRDDAVEAQLALCQEVVRAVRDVRSQHNVPPARRVDLAVRADGESAGVLSALASIVTRAAGAGSMTVAPDVSRATDAAVAVVRDVEVHVTGVVDVAHERARLARQRDGLTARVAGVRGRLGNTAFVSRAKPEVVAREHAMLADLEQQLAAVDAALDALGTR
ncbi:valine--tRNA ligase [bacterium]|nr:MAG: valine--tRNA ligase [bacterium]